MKYSVTNFQFLIVFQSKVEENNFTSIWLMSKKKKKTKVDGKKNDQDLAALDWRKRSKMRQLMLHKLKVKTQLD